MLSGAVPQSHDNHKSGIVRFSDVRLGQSVELPRPEFETHAIEERVCELVREWSGSASASLVSMQQPDGGLSPDSHDGRVMARHLDGSNQADVEVLVRAQDVICLRAVVRVALG